MRVLRASKDSLMAILEAFVYDPLISFKLLAQNLMRVNKNEENKNKNNATPNKPKAEQIKDDAMEKIKHSIVEHVLNRYKDQPTNFPESQFSRFNESIPIQSVIVEGGEEVMKEDEEIFKRDCRSSR